MHTGWCSHNILLKDGTRYLLGRSNLHYCVQHSSHISFACMWTSGSGRPCIRSAAPAVQHMCCRGHPANHRHQSV
jgi:hypothetical protein